MNKLGWYRASQFTVKKGKIVIAAFTGVTGVKV